MCVKLKSKTRLKGPKEQHKELKASAVQRKKRSLRNALFRKDFVKIRGICNRHSGIGQSRSEI